MGKSGVHAKRSCLGVWATILLKARTQKVSQSLGPCQAGRCQGAREGHVVIGHPSRVLPLANHLQKHSPKLYMIPIGKTAAASRRARTPGLQASAVELGASGRPPCQTRRRSHLPLTSLVAAVAEGPGEEPGACPGGSVKPPQRWAAARVPAGSRRAPAEAMRGTEPPLPSGL